MSIEVKGSALQEACRKIAEDVNEDRIEEAIGMGKLDVLLRTAVNTRALKSYKEEPTDWEKAITVETGVNQLYQEYPMLSSATDGVDGAPPVEDGDALPELQWGADSATIRNVMYGHRAVITHMLQRFDQTGATKRMASDIGVEMARQNDALVAKLYNDGDTTTIYDGQPMFDLAGGHPNITGGAANSNNINGASLGNFSPVSLEAGMNMINKWQDLSGENTTSMPIKVIAAKDQMPHIIRTLGSSAPSDAAHSGVKNPWQNALDVVMFKRLEAGSWYLWTDTFGLVWNWVDKPVVEIENRLSGMSFTNVVNQYRIFEIVGNGCVNWRYGFKGN